MSLTNQMTYEQFINNILETRGRFNIPDGEYKERHHILPKCMGGGNEEENLIDLYAREHFEAHRLLAKENPEDNGLQFAWWNMCQIKGNSEQERYIPSSEEFEEARKKCAELSSKNNMGENHPMFGRHHSKETKEKMSKSHKGQLAGDKNPMFGRKHTEEEKKAISECGKKWHAEHVHPMTGVRRFGEDNPMFGKHLSEEQKEKLREIFTGSKNPRAKKIICDGVVYDTVTEFCKKNNLNVSTASCWLSGKNPMPEKWVKLGLKFYKEQEDAVE